MLLKKSLLIIITGIMLSAPTLFASAIPHSVNRMDFFACSKETAATLRARGYEVVCHNHPLDVLTFLTDFNTPESRSQFRSNQQLSDAKVTTTLATHDYVTLFKNKIWNSGSLQSEQELLLKFAQDGHAPCMLELGKSMIESGNHFEGLSWLILGFMRTEEDSQLVNDPSLKLTPAITAAQGNYLPLLKGIADNTLKTAAYQNAFDNFNAATKKPSPLWVSFHGINGIRYFEATANLKPSAKMLPVAQHADINTTLKSEFIRYKTLKKAFLYEISMEELMSFDAHRKVSSLSGIKSSPELKEKLDKKEAGVCNQCGKFAANKCGGCKMVCYCSLECQRSHWKTHKPECTAEQARQAGASASSAH